MKINPNVEIGETGKTIGDCIVESGSNQYGTYIKYGDGTMICSRKISGTVNITTNWGSLYVGENSDGWTFANTFIEPPEVQLTLQITGNYGACLVSYNEMKITNSYFQRFALMRPTSASAVAYTIHMRALGRWK